MVIAVDFDGTCVVDKFPYIGETVPNCLKVLRELENNGHKIILWTCRTDLYLDAAHEWFFKNDIELFGVNKNPESQHTIKGPKIYADIYIDDRALGCPKITFNKYKVVDWIKIKELLKDLL
jgi:hypothetical protein